VRLGERGDHVLGDAREIQGRYIREMEGRYKKRGDHVLGDAREMQGRYKGDGREIQGAR